MPCGLKRAVVLAKLSKREATSPATAASCRLIGSKVAVGQRQRKKKVGKVPYQAKSKLTNQCTRIATLRFCNGYVLAKKRVIVATIADPQSRDFKRWVLSLTIEIIKFQIHISENVIHVYLASTIVSRI